MPFVDFARPLSLLALIAGPLLGWLLLRYRRERRQDWSALGQTGRPPGTRDWLRVVAWPLLVVAIAGPRWGRSGDGGTAPGHDVVLLFDVSRSMGAEDAFPDRLGAAVRAAETLLLELARHEGERVAVVAFASRGRSICPLTEDLGAVAESLRSLRPGMIRPGGTDLAAGLDEALDAFDDEEPTEGRTVVVFSDGEDHPGAWRQALDRLVSARVSVHSVAVGDGQAGHTIPTRSGVLLHEGQPVASRREDLALETIRTRTEGSFIPLGVSQTDLGALYRDRIAPSARKVRDTKRILDPTERYVPFLITGIAILLVASWPVGRRRALLMTFLPLMVVLPGAGGSDTAPSLIAEGTRFYHSGDLASALERFNLARKLDPTSPIPAFNTAATLFQMGQFEEASELYEAIQPRADRRLAAKIDYALGNVAVARGAFREALGHYDRCLARPGADLDALKGDAAANRAFAVLRIPPPPQPESGGDRRAPKGGQEPKQPPPNEEKSKSPPSPSEGENNPGQPPPGGGSSGSGVPDPIPQGGEESPEQKLNRMLSSVNSARRPPQPIEAPSTDDPGDGKDW